MWFQGGGDQSVFLDFHISIPAACVLYVIVFFPHGTEFPQMFMVKGMSYTVV